MRNRYNVNVYVGTECVACEDFVRFSLADDFALAWVAKGATRISINGESVSY